MSDPNQPAGPYPLGGDQGGSQGSSGDLPPNQGGQSPTFPPYGQPPTSYPYGQPGAPSTPQYPYGQPGMPSQPLYPYGQPGTPPTMPPYPAEGGQAATVDPSQPLYPYPYGQPGAPSQPLYPYGQPGAPSTPQYPYGTYGPTSQAFPSAEVAPKKSHRGLIIGLVAGVLVLALLGGGAVVGINQYQAPANAAQQFCTTLKAQDYVAAYALFSPQFQAQYTQAQFTAASQTLDKVEGNVTACGEAAGNAYSYALFGSTATISSVITRAQSGSLTGKLHLVNSSGWKISGIDTSLLGVNLASLQVLSSYCSALQQQDYMTAYSYLGSTLQSQVSESAFSEQASLHEQVDGAVTDCAVTAFSSDDSDTTTNVIVSITRATLGQVSGAISLDLESGSWKISSVATALEGSDLSALLVVQQFCAYLTANEPAKAYDLTSSAFRSALPLSEFDSLFDISGITYGCTLQYSTYKVTDPTNAQISGDITLSAEGTTEPVPFTFNLVKVGSKWELDSLE